MHHAITLEALRVIDTIDKKGSFGAAAEALFKVPSALSYTVQKLENDLGVILFDRSKQKAQLTASGRILLERGRELLKSAALLEDTVQQIETGWETRIRIAIDSILPILHLFEQVRVFTQLDKCVQVDINEEVLGGTWEALVADRCDLALGAAGDLPKGVYEAQHIGDAEFVFAVCKEHPLTEYQGPIDAAAIRNFPTVVTADSSLNSPARSSGLLESRQTIRVDSMSAKIRAQSTGAGIGFLPKHLIHSELERGTLVVLPCEIPRPKAPLYMAWKKENKGRACDWFVKATQNIQWLD